MRMIYTDTVLDLVSEKKIKKIPKTLTIKHVLRHREGNFSMVVIAAKEKDIPGLTYFAGVAKRDSQDPDNATRGLTIAATRAVNSMIYTHKNSYGQPCPSRNDKYRAQGAIQCAKILLPTVINPLQRRLSSRCTDRFRNLPIGISSSSKIITKVTAGPDKKEIMDATKKA
jgi:hypothetical protein